MDIYYEKREIKCSGEYDIIIAGGGIAGVAAALAAKRLGSKVLLIEKSVTLGGLATLGLISWYEPLCDGNGRHIIKGIAEELLLLSIQYGPDDLADHWKEKGEVSPKARRYATHYSPSIFALALNDLMKEEGVDLRLDMLASYPIMEENILKGLIVESKSGREFFKTKVMIDATGDADIIHRAGVPCRKGENFLSYVAHGYKPDDVLKYMDSKNSLDLRRWFFCGSNLYGVGHPEGLRTFSGTTNEDVTEFVRLGQDILFEKVKNKELDEGDIMVLPGMAQYRTTRSIKGEYELTIEDEGVFHEDSIGAIGDFRKRNVHYNIPYTCLYNKDYPNILAAGRIVSSMGDGWEVTRVIPVAALTGQAAGTAAHLMSENNQGAPDVSLDQLQKLLIDNGVEIHF